MKILILTASPNDNGLTASCAESAKSGASDNGAEVTTVKINALNIGKCSACANGWGTCRDKHVCQVQDDFQKLHKKMLGYDGYILITPVYWGEMSESMKAFTDRLRRNEALNEKSLLRGKPFIAVAAAGGSGNGTMTCLSSMERLIHHLGGRVFDLIAITRFSRSHKLNTIKESAYDMTSN